MIGKLRVTCVQAFAYAAPEPAKAAGRSGPRENLVIRLEGNHRSTTAVGVGEAAPRGPRTTGDATDGAWEFLVDACRSLEGTRLSTSSRRASLDRVREVMSELSTHAASTTPRGSREKPYRGTLAGIEMALLDLLARAHRVPVAALLGQQRQEIRVSTATIQQTSDLDSVKRRLQRNARRYPVIRVGSRADVKADVELLRFVAGTRGTDGTDQPIWLMAAEAYTLDSATELVDRIAAAMRSGDLPQHVIVEQPIARNHRPQLATLQRHANEALHGSGPMAPGSGKLSIMASQSVWDESDLASLHDAGGCAAIAIDSTRTGGLLASVDLARTATRHDPETEIAISGPRAVSTITTAATRSLALASPRLDYYTVLPANNAVTGIGTPAVTFTHAADNVLDQQEGNGLGVDLSQEALGHHVTRATRAPAPSAAATNAADTANAFEFPYLEKFNKIRRDSNLLEHEALTRGLDTLRVSPLIFSAWSADQGKKIAFYRTSSDVTAIVTAVATTHKQITRNLLQRAGVTVPEGRRFTLDQRAEAVAYGRELGWPLVVKPQSGAGGKGVTANISAEEQLVWAIDSLDETKDDTFVVERHVDGEDYRFIVLDDRVLSVLKGGPANVVGDGVSTVAELIEAKNLVRRTKQRLQGRQISLNDRARFQLEREGLAWDSVPEAGRKVTLSTSGNLALGGESIQVLEETHPSLIEMAVRAVRALPRFRYCGIDFLLTDHRLPLEEQSAGICELNSSPANAAHHFPMYGKPQNVTRALFEARCEHAGVPIDEPSTTLDIAVEIRGKVQGVGYRQWLSKLAHEYGISGSARNSSDPTVVEARLTGESGPVAALASLAVTGPRNARPQSVRTRHCAGSPPTGKFVIES